jgi:hypothetical protein
MKNIMPTTKSPLFDEDEFRRKLLHMVPQNEVTNIVNGEKSAFEKIKIDDTVIRNLTDKYIGFLMKGSLPL